MNIFSWLWMCFFSVKLLLIQCGITKTTKIWQTKILEHLISLLMIVLSIKAKLFAQKKPDSL